MVETILDALVHFVTSVIGAIGYTGIFVLMAAESANIPIPSEAIMPFAGFLAASGQLSVLGAAIVGTLGNLAGSLLSWWIGATGGRKAILRYGRVVRLNEHHLDAAEAWFKKYGEVSVFVGRLLPIVRTFISLPAGLAKMNVVKFSIYTVLGAFPFCYFLAWVGFVLGERWEEVRKYFHYADYVVIVGMLAVIVYVIVKRRNKTDR